MHENLTEKLLLLERLLLRHDYHELMLRTRVPQLHQKVLRIHRLKEEQIKLLDDLLREMEQYSTRAVRSLWATSQWTKRICHPSCNPLPHLFVKANVIRKFGDDQSSWSGNSCGSPPRTTRE